MSGYSIYICELDSGSFSTVNQMAGPDTHIHVICTSGSAAFRIDAKDFELNDGELLDQSRCISLEALRCSDDFRGRLAVLSRQYLSEIIRWQPPFSADCILNSINRPVTELDQEKLANIIHALGELEKFLGRTDEMFGRDMLDCAMRIYLMEIASVSSKSQDNDSLKNFSARRLLVRQLMDLVSKNVGKEQRVPFYADSLFVSANYLNRVCREMTGQSVKNLIDTVLLFHINSEIARGQLSMQQIAYKYNFSSSASFSRFYTRMTGRPPEKSRSKKLSK